jgi:putative membrane protein insertion efficiency factor
MLPSPISIETSGRRGAVAGPASGHPADSQMSTSAATALNPAQRLLTATIRGYQLAFSPFFAGSCRYLPSCSAYALEAVERHGTLRGGWLALRRLARCHPLGGHGLDPVPDFAPADKPAGTDTKSDL